MLTEHLGPGFGRYPAEKRVEEATLGCPHCGTCVVKNPLRQRPREYCRHCDRYICDFCYPVTQQAGYIHRSFAEIADLVRSGRFTLSGPMSNPILIPTSPPEV